MKRILIILKTVITIIALLVFASGVAVAAIGVYEIILAVSDMAEADRHHVATKLATGMLKAVDMFLMAIVFFVFSLGLLILFVSHDAELPVKVPDWLRIKTFTDLKVILWESILTTLVVSYLVGLAELKMAGVQVSTSNLIIPGVIFLISISLFLLKKKEKDH